MALFDADLVGFTIEAERKPEKTGGVTVSSIPSILVKLLEAETPKALKDPDYRLVLRLPVRFEDDPEKSEDDNAKGRQEAKAKAVADVKQLALYASAWGKGKHNGVGEDGKYDPKKDERIYITRLPNLKDERDEPVARMKVQMWRDVPQDNRPGRR